VQAIRGAGPGLPDVLLAYAFISGEFSAMRVLRAVLATAGSVFELSRLVRLMAVAATVLATTVAVLLAAFVAVAVSLI
jgi:hypothetical protein